jgi:ATPase
MALIEGLEVIFSTSTEVAPATPSPKSEEKVRHIEDFFDDQTMSVHLIGHCVPLVKRGQPGDWRLEQIGSTPLEPKELEEIAVKILTEAKTEEGCFIERDLPGVQVVQRRKYRIVICRPPFSNVMEITIVRPLVSLTLDDYKLPKQVLDRLEIAEGILVAGAPGAGKSTFISALTAFYQKKHKIVKTLESVRDLVVSPEVIQYSPLDGNMEKTADILLLVRPDYTIFDEVRVESDFKIFGDMRLAGVGMVGVVHASRAVDAIQRFIRRIELGVIPNIIDTIIFIRSGQIEEVLSTHMVVKTPTGFTDRDLARPVIEVRDFLNNGLLYEIYAFGSDVVVAPVGRPDTRRNPLRDRFTAKGKRLPPREARMQRLQEMIDDDKAVSEDDEHEAQNGADLGTSNGPEGNMNVYLSRRSKSIVLMVGARVANDYLHFFTEDGVELFAATLNRRGEVAIKKNSPLYNRLEKIMHNGTRLYGKRE